MTSLRKNIIREIKNTKSRFISILAIVALSVGFFSGVKAASPSMVNTAEKYFISQNLMDIRLVSTVGFDESDIEAIKNSEDVVSVMPGYFSDLLVKFGDVEKTVRAYSIPTMEDGSEPINKPVIIEGRMPEQSGECVIENASINSKNYKIGDKITFADNVNGISTDTYIKMQEYTIVGIVESPLYLSFQRENTNVGSGTIAFYMMLMPEDFVTERYTNVYVTTTASQSGYQSFSEDYEALIEKDKTYFENLSLERVDIFEKTTLADAEQKLFDAQTKYSEGKTEANQKISDGINELNSAQEKFNKGIFDAQREIEKNEALIEQGKAELAEAQETYQLSLDDALKQISEAQEQYDDGKKKYNEALNTYNTQISQAQALLDKNKKEYENAYNLFYFTTKPEAEQKLELLGTLIKFANSTISTLKEQIEELEQNLQIESSDELKNQLNELKKKLDEALNTVDDYQKQYDEALQQLEAAELQLSDAQKQLDEAENELNRQKLAGQTQLDKAKQELDTAENQISLAKLQYETEMNKGALKISTAQSEIQEGEKKLEQGKAELEKQYTLGQEELKAARETLIVSKQEAKEQLEDAESQIIEAENQIEKLKNAAWYVYTRDDIIGYSSLTEDAQRVDSIAEVFPVFFLLVAVLVCLTTLSRMVEERRTEIGTFKALGYSNAAITCKYCIYAGIAAVIGSIVGLICGLSTLPYIIVETYGILYTLPKTSLSIPWDSVIISTIVALICTCGVALFACLKELKRNAAVLMRPKAPKPGKRIILERITPLWKHLNFTTKVTARNLFRYKARFFMTVIGVAGCTALIIAGFGLKNSISVIADRQFKEITTYDAIFALSSSKTQDEQEYLMSQFEKDKHFNTVLLSCQKDTSASFKNSKKTISSGIVIGADKEAFEEIYHLRNSSNHEKIELTDNGIVITERMSAVISASVGDVIDITINEKTVKAKVSGIAENYAGNYTYMTPTYYKQLSGEEPEYNMVLVTLTEYAQQKHDDISAEWMPKDEIVTISFIADTVSSVEDMLQSLNIIVLVMILCAGLLAIVVLYNLTNINIAERVREIATIKVLGFYNGEAAAFIYRENIALTVVGSLVGLILGAWLNNFIIDTIQMDMVMFAKEINVMCFVLGVLLTFIFSALVNFIMYFKMKKISMVESLKSIE